MPIISLIAAIDEANGLGLNNQLLCHLPADLLHFKTLTMGKPIIMGRKTYESIGRPLPGRLNIVVSRSVNNIAGTTIVNSLSQAIKASDESELMIIGGAELYKQSIAIANRLYITRIHHHFAADVFFPEIDPSIWHCQNQIFRQRDEKNSYDMTFYVYENYLNSKDA